MVSPQFWYICFLNKTILHFHSKLKLLAFMVNDYAMYTEINFELKLTKNRVKESAERVQLSVVRSGHFDEIYNPSVEYRISETGSSIALGTYLL